ncbi:MAG: hypothetical protein RL540_375 [Actinomycetota bacterium]
MTLFSVALMMKGKADGGGCLLVVVVWERRAGGRWALFIEEICLLPIPTLQDDLS